MGERIKEGELDSSESFFILAAEIRDVVDF